MCLQGCLPRKFRRSTSASSGLPDNRRPKNGGLYCGLLCIPSQTEPKEQRITAHDYIASLLVTQNDYHHTEPSTAENEIFGSHQTAETVGRIARNALLHSSGMVSQFDMPRVQHPTLSLHLTCEPREGVSLGFLNRLRLFFLKKRMIWLRKHSEVEEINHNPHGIPRGDELQTLTLEHVAYNRRKLFDVASPIESRRYAADSILDDFDILCPHRPNPNFKQMSRVRDRTRLCLIGRSTAGIPFEASDFMARWVFRRCLQRCELNGLQLTRIQEQSNLEEDYDLSKMGHYQLTKCFASKLVAARRWGQTVQCARRNSMSWIDSQYSISAMPSLSAVAGINARSIQTPLSMTSIAEIAEHDEPEHHELGECVLQSTLPQNAVLSESSAHLSGDGAR